MADDTSLKLGQLNLWKRLGLGVLSGEWRGGEGMGGQLRWVRGDHSGHLGKFGWVGRWWWWSCYESKLPAGLPTGRGTVRFLHIITAKKLPNEMSSLQGH